MSDTTTFERIVADHARSVGDALAFIDADNTISWRQLDALATRAARRLLADGVEPGLVVAVRAPNCIEYVAIRLALDRIGAATLALSTRLGAHEVRAMIEQTDAARLITWLPAADEDDYDRLFGELASNGQLRHVLGIEPWDGGDELGFRPIAGAPQPAVVADIDAMPGRDPADIALYMVTSGTTGLPKAFGRSDEAFLFRARIMVEALELGPADVLYSPAPVTQGIGSLFGFASIIVSGATGLLTPHFSPTRAVELIDRWDATVIGGVPTHAYRIHTLADSMGHDLTCLRAIALGGAGAAAQAQQQLEQRFDCIVLNYYGMGELGIPSMPTIRDEPELRHGGIGKIVDGVEVAILDDDGHPLPGGEVGEICIRGAGVSAGYVSEATLFDDDGWGHSGDLGYIDEHDRLHMVGRKKELIIRGGLNISPSEIEQALLTHPDIAQCVCLGVPDHDLGEVVAAIVVPAAGAPAPTGEDVRSWLVGRGLSQQKLPAIVLAYDRLPVTEVGKINRSLLAEDALARRRDEHADAPR